MNDQKNMLEPGDAATTPDTPRPAEALPAITPIVSFRTAAFGEAREINVASDTVRVTPVPGDDPPSAYIVEFRGIEHLVLGAGGVVTVSSDPIVCTVHFSDEYLRSTNPALGYATARIETPLFHPNRAGGADTGASVVCLGASFRPGTRLRPLVFQLYRFVSSRDFATESPLDANASRYYTAHLDQVRGLRAAPLWRERVGRQTQGGNAETVQTIETEPAQLEE